MMPSKSKKQHNFMEAVAHSPEFAKKAGVPQSVGKEFSKADKGKTFKRGGEMAESKSMMKKEVSFMKKKGAPASMLKHETAEMAGMKKGGGVKKMAMGGPTAPAPAGAPMDPRKAAMIAQMMRARRPGMAPTAAPAPTAMPGMKKGGAVFTKSADGIAQRGKTKASQIKMAKGGSAKKYC
jgi:hypothetical protein